MSAAAKLLLIYFCGISAVSAIVTGWDKRAAEKHRWRVPESTLLFLSALGGSAAMYLVMRAIHHKTLHKKFMVGIPVIFALQLLLLFWLLHSGWLL
ncbi:MAG: DUF1294 domain-containing protein [Oscillospiraceae bacterium]|jgi:uncharacterized membrane protein YsdA (DUF1294 family)|nr:DUF1294 domain-containing protein [Oscillospiraceae bacterium]MDD3262184.1 DUF1294 domain-containing protein [Oscillospiraceae bacterium]